MKNIIRIISIVCMILVFMPVKAQVPEPEHEPSRPIYCVDGIYYSVISEETHEAEVVCGNQEWKRYDEHGFPQMPSCYYWQNWYSNSYKGEVIIPETVVIPQLSEDLYTVTSIGVGAFWQCLDLTKVHVPKTIKKIKHGAFDNCRNLLELILPDEIEEIGIYGFAYCHALSRLHFPKSCTRIEHGLLEYSGSRNGSFELEGVSNVSSIGINGLLGLEINVLPQMPKLETIEYYGLSETNIKELDLSYISRGENLLNNYNFNDNKLLRTIILPQSSPDYLDRTFYGCLDIRYIKIFNVEPPALSSDWAANVAEGCVLDVPDESVEKYRNAPYWGNFAIIKSHTSSVQSVASEEIKVRCEDGMLQVESPMSVKVYDAAGHLQAQGGELSLALPAGIYIVSAPGYSRKVAVR